ncbi:MAG: hypothetical protein ABF377_05595 [Akkermansiaceae bacterium]
MSTSSSSTAWMPFQCPACFGLFRVTREEANAQGSCPSCDARLLIPSLDEIKEILQREKTSFKQGPSEIESAPEPARVEREESSAYAQAEIVNTSEDSAPSRKKKKIFIGSQPEELDWEEGQEQKSEEGIPWFLIGSVVLFLVLIVGVGAHFVRNTALSRGDGTATNLPFDEEVAERKLESADADAEDDIAVKMIEKFERFDLEKVLAAVEGFMEADTVAERAGYSRFPKPVLSLMEEYYGGTSFEAEGFRKFDQLQISYRDNLLSSFVQTRDFSWVPIVVEKNGDDYRVDWESWVGYSEMTIGELIEKKPTDPVKVRAVILRQSYFNYGFSDDKKWSSFRLSLHDEDRSLWAYIDRSDELSDRLDLMLKDGREVPAVFLIKYPKNARADDQVIIVEMVSTGWVEKRETEKK